MGDQLSSRRYEELLGIPVYHKLTFEKSPFKYCPKNQSKNTHPGKNIKVHASREAENYQENVIHNMHIVH